MNRNNIVGKEEINEKFELEHKKQLLLQPRLFWYRTSNCSLGQVKSRSSLYPARKPGVAHMVLNSVLNTINMY